MHLFSHPIRIRYSIQNLNRKLLNAVGFQNFPKCYPVPGGKVNITENINIYWVSEKLERGQKSIAWGLIKINGNRFTKERLTEEKEKKEVKCRKL